MSKTTAKTDNRQRSLFDSTAAQSPSPRPAEGSAQVGDRLRLALVNAIRECGLSRWEITGKRSHLLSCEVSKFMLDAWTAESKDGHRFPAEYLPAFCIATGSRRPLEVVAEASGVSVRDGEDVQRAEIQKLYEQAGELRQEAARMRRNLRNKK
jgi:hypothetical protein